MSKINIKYILLRRMYSCNSITRKFFYLYIQKYEGGQFYSQSLRSIFRDLYDIDAGIGSYGCFTTNFRPHVKIGNYCSIAPGVQRLVGNHPMNHASTHPIFYNKGFGIIEETKYSEHKLSIGNDVWIGVNAIITGNCENIGDGVVIGAGAVVTHNIEPYSIVVGCPAKVIRYRFSPEIQKQLMNSKWFELTPEQLKPAASFANNIDKFIDIVTQIRK